MPNSSLTSPLAIFVRLNISLPVQWPSIEPELVCEEALISPDQLEKALICQLVFQDHLGFEDNHVFEKIALGLNERTVDFDRRQDLSAGEVVYAVVAMRILDPKSPFSSEVLAYISAVLANDGITICPKMIEGEKSLIDSGMEFNIQFFLNEGNFSRETGDPTNIAPSYMSEGEKEVQLNIVTYVESRLKEMKEQVGSVLNSTLTIKK